MSSSILVKPTTFVFGNEMFISFVLPEKFKEGIEYTERPIIPVEIRISLKDGKNVAFIVPYYRSTGENSSIPNFWFPFYCIVDNSIRENHCGGWPQGYKYGLGWFSKFIGQHIRYSRNDKQVTAKPGSIQNTYFARELQQTLADDNVVYHDDTITRFVNFLGYMVNYYFFNQQLGGDSQNAHVRTFERLRTTYLSPANIRVEADRDISIHRVTLARHVNEYLDRLDIEAKCRNSCLVNYWKLASDYLAIASELIFAYIALSVDPTTTEHKNRLYGELGAIIDQWDRRHQCAANSSYLCSNHERDQNKRTYSLLERKRKQLEEQDQRLTDELKNSRLSIERYNMIRNKIYEVRKLIDSLDQQLGVLKGEDVLPPFRPAIEDRVRPPRPAPPLPRPAARPGPPPALPTDPRSAARPRTRPPKRGSPDTLPDSKRHRRGPRQ